MQIRCYPRFNVSLGLGLIHVSRSTAKSVLCQLCGTLLVGETTFVAGVALSADGGIGDTGCTAVGIATHYFLLAAFGWMLADAVYGNFDVIFGDRWSEWLSGWSMWWLVWWCPSSSVMSLGLRPFHTRWLALTTPLVLCDILRICGPCLSDADWCLRSDVMADARPQVHPHLAGQPAIRPRPRRRSLVPAVYGNFDINLTCSTWCSCLPADGGL